MRTATSFLALAFLSMAPGARAQMAVEYYHLDAVGTVLAVTNEAGALVEEHDYDVFGQEVGAQAGTQPKRFAGKERDGETGWDYFGARYYGSKVGRFTTTDPVYTWKENLVDPQRWNRYAYARNNPLKFVDPDGRVLVLSGAASARSKAQTIATNGMFGQQLVIGANGTASLVKTSVIGPASPQQLAMEKVLRDAISDPKTISISLSEGSTSTAAGSFYGNDIDVDDVAKFGQGPVTSAAGVFGHEIAEQQAGQAAGQVYAAAHAVGIQAQSAITGWRRGATNASGLTSQAPLTGRTKTTFTQGAKTRDVVVQWQKSNVVGVTQ